MNRKMILSRSILLVTLCGIAWLYSQTDLIFNELEEVAAELKEGVQVEQQAKEIELQTLRGEQVSLHGFKGKSVVINFFATWCHPCQEEMPLIVELDKRLTERDAVFLAVNLTSQEQSESEIKPFLSYYGAGFDPLLDREGEVMDTYQIIGIPTTLVIDEKGTIVRRINGQLTAHIIEDILSLL